MADEMKIIEIALRKAYLEEELDDCLKANEVKINAEGKAVNSEKLKKQNSLSFYIIDFMNKLADVKVELWKEKNLKESI